MFKVYYMHENIWYFIGIFISILFEYSQNDILQVFLEIRNLTKTS